MEQKVCPHCQYSIPLNAHFCPNCGKEVMVDSVSVGKQISVYLISFLLPPLGLWPGIKYLRNSNPSVKRVGVIALILTILSVIISIWMTMAIINQATSTINSQLQQIQY